MFGNINEEARNYLLAAKDEMNKLKHNFVGTEHFILALLKNNNNIKEKLENQNITYDVMYEKIIKEIGIGNNKNKLFLYSPVLKKILENANTDAIDENSEVNINHIFLNILENPDGVGIRLLLMLDVDINELYKEVLIKKNKKKYKKLKIEELGKNLNNCIFDPVIGRDKEINRLIEILARRTKNNPILVGSAGVGKTAIVEELSKRINQNNVPSKLKNKKIYQIDMSEIVAGTKYRGEFEDKIRNILKEVENDSNIILFIDEIHTIMGAGGAEGAIDASNILKPALARGNISVIGATTLEEYKKFITEDKALERRFQKITIEETNKEITIQILNKLKPIYEEYHNAKIKKEDLEKIVELSIKYIKDRKQPDASIDILDEVLARTSLKTNYKFNKVCEEINELENQINYCLNKKKYSQVKLLRDKKHVLEDKLNNENITKVKINKCSVNLKDIAKIINEKTNIPIYEILKDNKKSILTFEKKLNSLIVGQDHAKKEIIKLTKLKKLGLNENNCQSYLFLGPSGVGKTAMAHIFGENLVGEDNVIKIDMSELKEAHSISKLIGSPPGYVGYKDNTNYFEEIKNKPASVIILDEIEKAHKDILNIFYQILEFSRVKDSKGDTIHFNNTVIIMTSNIGSLKENLGFAPNDSKIESELKETLGLPFINRIDNLIFFKKLNKEEIRKIINFELNKITKKFTNVKIDKQVIEELIEESKYKIYGARKLKKLIKEKVKNQIIESLLNNENRIHLKTIKEFSSI